MISTKGRYALRVMIDLAMNDEGRYIPLKDVAERQSISKKYLEIIVKELVKGGMIEGVSGRGGGYRLCRDPGEYTAGEIIELMEGSLSPVMCLTENAAACPMEDQCLTLPLWKEYYEMSRDYFYGKKLSDLIR